MGSDKRITDLAPLSDAGVNSLLNSLALEVDDPSLSATESRQILLSQLLSNRDIPDNTTTAYKAVTEAGLMKTLATKTKRGLARFATDAEVAAKTGGVALAAVDFPLAMRTETAVVRDITLDNLSSHIMGYSPVPMQTNVCWIRVRQVGKLVYVEGNLAVTYSGTVSRLGIVFFTGSMPKPDIDQGVCIVMEYDGRYLSCGGIVTSDTSYTIMRFDAPRGINFPASPSFRFGFTYAAL